MDHCVEPLGFGFSNKQRLKKPLEFRAVFTNGQKIGGRYFNVYGAPNELSCARLGLAVPKRNLRFSVQRNRVKRLIRESFRHQQDFHHLDVIVLAKASVLDSDPLEVRNHLERQWKRLSQRYKN